MKYLLNGQESKRLKFRLLEKNDFNIWVEFFRHKEVSKYIGMDTISTAEKKAEKWFEFIENRYENDLGGMNALIDKETNEFIGQCGLLIQDINGKKELEIGYSIMPKFWNKGYATEAAIKCKDFAFENNYSETIISIIHIENKSSEKVAKKNGMKRHSKAKFKGMPVNIFRIEKKEWLRNKKNNITI